jgi:hypothetical protein
MSEAELEEKTEFTFDELDERAKDRVRDSRRYYDVADNDWWNFDDYVECAERLGIEIGQRSFKTVGGKTAYEPTIFFSLSYCQGDGASYTGRYTYAPEALKAIKEHAGQDQELHRIATELTALQVAIKLSHNGSGTATAVISISHRDTMEFDVSVDGDDSDDCYGPAWPEFEKALCQLLRDFADWIYNQLKAEYEYLTSDDHVDERIGEMDLKFDEDGDEI